MDTQTFQTLKATPPKRGFVFNVKAANARIAELAKAAGETAPKFIYNIAKANREIARLTAAAPAATPKAAQLKPAELKPALAAMAAELAPKLGVTLPDIAALAAKAKETVKTLATGNFGEQRKARREYFTALCNSPHEALIAENALVAAGVDFDSALDRLIAKKEATLRAQNSAKLQAAAKVRLDARRSAVKAGQSAPELNLDEVSAIGRMIFTGAYNLEHCENIASDKALFWGEKFHAARIALPWSNPYKPSAADESKTSALDPKRQSMAKEMIGDFLSVLDGKATVESFDRGGCKAARAYLRDSCGDI